jgi:hypothetical protein
MKIKLSKSQWEGIGKKAGWIKEVQENQGAQEASFKDKMTEATRLAFQCIYETVAPDGTYLTERRIELPDQVWGWADGLVQDNYMRQIEGRTSLKGLTNFDMGKAEKDIDRDIESFKQILSRIGLPKKLTVEEYRAMGYK